MTEDSGNSSDDSFPRDEDAYWEFMDGTRDVYICESCGTTSYRAFRGGEPGAFYAEVDGKPAVVCYECDDNYEWDTIESRIRERRRSAQRSIIGEWIAPIRNVLRPVSNRIPVPLSIHNVKPQRRTSMLLETTLFLGRLGTVIGLTAVVLAGIAIFAALTGALFV